MYEIERDISNLLIKQGFNRIETPTLEHFEVLRMTFSEQYHLLIRKEISSSLRPDITSQIGRVIVASTSCLKHRLSSLIRARLSGIMRELRGLANEHTHSRY